MRRLVFAILRFSAATTYADARLTSPAGGFTVQLPAIPGFTHEVTLNRAQDGRAHRRWTPRN